MATKDPTKTAAAKNAAAAAAAAAAKAKTAPKKTSPADKAAAASAKAKEAQAAATAAEKEQEKAAKEQEKARKAADVWLENTAKRVNAVVSKIETYDGKADNFRATLSVHLAEAEEVCKGNGIKFKEWAEQNVVRLDGEAYSYGEIRRLVRVGNSDDPIAAIADMRNKTAARVKKHADAKKDEAATTAAPPSVAPVISTASADTVFEAFEALSSKAQIAVLKKAGKSLGLTITKGSVALWPTASGK